MRIDKLIALFLVLEVIRGIFLFFVFTRTRNGRRSADWLSQHDFRWAARVCRAELKIKINKKTGRR